MEQSQTVIIWVVGIVIVSSMSLRSRKRQADESLRVLSSYSGSESDLQCLQTCLERYRGDPQYELVKKRVRDRRTNLKLMLRRYKDDLYIGDETESILRMLDSFDGEVLE